MEEEKILRKIETLFEENKRISDWENWIRIEALKLYLSAQSDEVKLSALEMIRTTFYLN